MPFPFVYTLLSLLLAGGVAVALVVRLIAHRRQRRSRIQVEDALKHLHAREYDDRTGSLDSVAGALSLQGDIAADLATRMEARGLISSDAGRISLTEEGRSHALSVVLRHRLWETHLSEETDLPDSELHVLADEAEHEISEDEARRLSRQLGNPSRDPHGDPIPTESGDVAPTRGVALPDLPRGVTGRIVHLEDEPVRVYNQLVEEGLHVGQMVRAVEVEPTDVVFQTEDAEHRLPRLVAAAVRVIAASPGKRRTRPLTEVAKGETAMVARISSGCRGLTRRRLLDFGVVPGATVTPELVSAAGDPVAYRIRGTVVALRKAQAAQIRVYVSEAENGAA